eukprot:TRINITY_DN14824_c0_g1_i1.p1 TRINITY_DN14824_c0_g1~~TRINITY_DN14824_c0_g1_i1.p1  ORF type:complete len:963 (-),score=169.05 TRINITY_DN14824_c0_g1_i1:32-2920(-)
MAAKEALDQTAIEKIFDEWDANKDGTISREEFKGMVNSLTDASWSDEQISKVFDAADADRNGRLDFTELLNWVWSDAKNRLMFQNTHLSPAQECEQIQGVEQAANGLKSGQHYFLIGRKWYVQWLEWAGLQSTQNLKRETSLDALMSLENTPEAQPSLKHSWSKERPGPIDNSGLFDPVEKGKLNCGICEHRDYEILSKEEWTLLQTWYGGGPVIKRRAITEPSGAVMIELYGITLKVLTSTNLLAEPTIMTESKTISVATFKKHACEEFGLEPNKVRVWDYFGKRKTANLENEPNKSLDDCRIFDNNDMLLELQLADGKWPDTGAGGTSFVRPADVDVATAGTPLQRGAVGLQNLGNTCFMNSSIQCLSNIPEFRDYFVTEKYKDEVNPTAHKTHGKLATASAQLLQQLWDPNTVRIAPRNFKWQIGQFAEQFSGFGQQDSMEFVEYFLDGLKEDLNRVQGAKPYVETSEAEGRSDEVVAEEALQNYLKRNDSRIDELFLGLFKSTVTCPDPSCDRVSVTFDPYLSVKLTLMSTADERSMKINVLVVPQPSITRTRTALATLATKIEPSQHCVSVANFATAGDLIQAAANSAGLQPETCTLTEVYDGKIYKHFELKDPLDRIGGNDTLVLYELESLEPFQMTFEDRWLKPGDKDTPSKTPCDQCGVVIYQRQCRGSKGSSGHSYSTTDMIGLPMLACVSKKTSSRDVFATVRFELEKLIGSKAGDGWKLFRTKDKFDVSRCKESLEDDDTSLSFEPREYLIVEWPEGADTHEVGELKTRLIKSKVGGGKSGEAEVDLRKCFQMFCETDQLPATDAWYCNKCKEHREAFKKMEFWSLPRTLILQLKRFTYSEWRRDRLDTPVAFPLEGLDLSSYCVRETAGASLIYDLAAMSIHMGGLGGGHYIAYARGENGKWHEYNDGTVSEITPAKVAQEKSGAYVLFYIRRDHRPSGWGPPLEESASR